MEDRSGSSGFKLPESLDATKQIDVHGMHNNLETFNNIKKQLSSSDYPTGEDNMILQCSDDDDDIAIDRDEEVSGDPYNSSKQGASNIDVQKIYS